MTGSRILPLALVLLVAAGGLAWLLGLFGGDAERGPSPTPPEPGPARAVRPETPLPPRPREVGTAPRETAEPGKRETDGPDDPAGVEASDPDRPALFDPLDPDSVPNPMGVVEIELAGELEGAVLTATVHRKAEGEREAIRAHVASDGRVLVPKLEEGEWTLEVAAEKDGRVVREKRQLTVAKGQERIETEPIRILPDAGIRARAVDADGSPIPHATVVVCREEEKPEEARRLAPGRGGWVLYGDLEPANYHRVVALGLPRELSETVRTPNREREVVEVELKADDRLVFCRVTLRLPGGAPAGALLVARPVRTQLRPDDRELQGEFLPGIYRIEATIRGRAGLYVGNLAVPATGPYEGQVDLLRSE